MLSLFKLHAFVGILLPHCDSDTLFALCTPSFSFTDLYPFFCPMLSIAPPLLLFTYLLNHSLFDRLTRSVVLYKARSSVSPHIHFVITSMDIHSIFTRVLGLWPLLILVFLLYCFCVLLQHLFVKTQLITDYVVLTALSSLETEP